MPPIIASIIFTIGILGLFYLDRHEDSRVSKALWIPAVWLFLISSRPAIFWLGMAPNSGAYYVEANSTEVYVEGSPVDRAVLAFLVLAALAVLVARSGRVGPLLRKNVLILLYFSFCAASIVWSDFPFVALKRFTKAIGDLGVVLIILTESDPSAALKRLVARLGFLLFPLSILFIKYYPDIGRRLTNSWTLEPIGVTLQKNGLGVDCMMYGVFFLWMIVSVYREREDPGRPRRLLAYGTIIAMIIWLLSQCNSTTFRRRYGQGVGKGPDAYGANGDLESGVGPAHKPMGGDGLRELLARAATGKNAGCVAKFPDQRGAQWLHRGLFESWMGWGLLHRSFVGDWI